MGLNYMLIFGSKRISVSVNNDLEVTLMFLSQTSKTQTSSSSQTLLSPKLLFILQHHILYLLDLLQRLRVMCTVVVLVWLMSWTPYLIVFLLPQLGLSPLVTPYVTTIPAILAKLSACLNPFIYGLW